MRHALVLLLLLALPLPAAAGDDCSGCHGGDRGLVAATYRASKHGVIAGLQPASGRAPACADCHPVTAAHARTPRAPAWTLTAEALRARLEPMRGRCGHCHAPRFVDQHLDASVRGLAVGVAKLGEARAVLAAVRREAPAQQARVDALAAALGTHLGALWLGHVHFSPDHQWWHGQAALDGDLLRLKGALTEARRSAARRARANR